ncbi:MAG: hypothetical protein CEO12_279 [Parcubacteria group bacterium Gr01-1014_46]|nr:MAG: hypothetical protein CEO12_279 [Parcubacteria group bacterium Gr01-1014_46]
MPSNRTLAVLVLCLGIVVSVWLFSKKSTFTNQDVVLKNTQPVSVDSIIKIEGEKNDDWKKILVNVDPKNQKVIDLTKNNTVREDDTTLTDQMSRDFLSQYLMAVKEGIDVTPEVASQIAQNTLSLPGYKQGAVVYIKENLRVSTKTDPESMRIYREKINQAMISVYFNVKDDPIAIVVKALQEENENELKKFDPIITINKDAIKSLLDMEVPPSAVKVHLDLLNTSSLILSDLESMRVAISDPVKVFSAIGSYSTHISSFSTALSNMSLYLTKNTQILLF